MAVAFCTPLDSDFDSCSANTPSVFDGVIGTTVKKFGAGAIESSDTSVPGSQQIRVLYSSMGAEGLPSDSGAWGYWFYFQPTATNFRHNIVLYPILKSKIDLIVSCGTGDVVAPNDINVYLAMHDSGGAVRVNVSSDYTVGLTTGWHYIELDWLWNDAGGKTEFFFDGTSLFSNTGGNSYARLGSDATNLELVYQVPTPITTKAYLDDFTIFTTRQNTSNFTAPSSPNCVCGFVPSRFMTLGAQLGIPNSLGR